jgi:hypothetical protein
VKEAFAGLDMDIRNASNQHGSEHTKTEHEKPPNKQK